jgi:hypothetical protein
MGVFVRMPPKHEEMKLGKPTGKRRKSPQKPTARQKTK